ncbi:hypothetical protein RB653_003713 [Dictyostelium firmibasis]|uniref:Uncharacterized protein n=1 Tax=Dictyostelium firmibasis TaxID=79012 RepID=A0AAN7U511_9MYCE
MGDLFLKVYKNSFLRKKIFKYIKISNQNYLTYNYYEFPIPLIIKTRNEVLLLEKLNFLIKNPQGDNYKHFINFNYDCLYQLFKWKELDFQLFYKIYKIFQFEIEQQFKIVSDSSDCLLVAIENYETLKFIVDTFNPTFCNCKNLEKFSFPSNNGHINESKNRFKILIDLITSQKQQQQQQQQQISFFKILEKIVEMKLSKEFGTMVLDKIGLFESNENNKAFLEKIIVYSDEYMFKIVLEIFKKKFNSAMDPFDSKINVYEIKVSIKTIDQFKIKPCQLMESSMVVLLKVMVSLPDDFIKKLKSNIISKIIVRDPNVALFILNSRAFDSIINHIEFSPSCIRNDLSNAVELFKRAPKRIWRISSPKHQTVEKFQFFIDKGIDLQKIYKSNQIVTISNDLPLVKLYTKHYKPPLTLLISAACENHREIVNYLFENYWDNHFKSLLYSNEQLGFFNFFSLLEFSIKNDHQLIFNNLKLEILKSLKIKNDIQNSLEIMFGKILQSPPLCRVSRFKFFNKLNNLPYFDDFIAKKTFDYKTKTFNHHLYTSVEKSNKKNLPFILKKWSTEISTSENPLQFEKNEFLNILFLCINNNWIFFIDQYLKKQLVLNKSNSFKKRLIHDLMASNPCIILYLISIAFFNEKEIEYIFETFIQSSDHYFSIKLVDFILFSKNNYSNYLIGILKSSVKLQNNSLLEYLLYIKKMEQNHPRIENQFKLCDVHHKFLNCFGLSFNGLNSLIVDDFNNNLNF